MIPQQNTLNLFSETLQLRYTDMGQGRPFLLLHGGAGPASMAGLGLALQASGRVIAPTLPGFNGTKRPSQFTRIADVTTAYLALIEKLDLRDVVLVGNSVGGWLAAEIALRRSPRIAGIVLLNAVGIDASAEGLTIANPMTVTPAERGAMAFHDPARFAIMPSGPDAAAAMLANQQVLMVYAGTPFMYDPTLRARLADMSVPTLVGWGVGDRIVTVDYGHLLASAIPGAGFTRIDSAGHFPQIEQLDHVARMVSDFAAHL